MIDKIELNKVLSEMYKEKGTAEIEFLTRWLACELEIEIFDRIRALKLKK